MWENFGFFPILQKKCSLFCLLLLLNYFLILSKIALFYTKCEKMRA